MNDLFQSKSNQLMNFCKSKGLVSKADIIEWGLKSYYLSADRRVRKFVEKGIMRKLPKEECLFKGLSKKMAYYEISP